MEPKFFIETKDTLSEIVKSNYKIFRKVYDFEPYSLKEYQKRLENKTPLIINVREKGQIIGDSISFKEESSLYLWILGVIEGKRKKGIGTKLLEMNENYAKEEGLKEIKVKVYNGSIKMQELLKKRGYEISNEKKDLKIFKLKLKE